MHYHLNTEIFGNTGYVSQHWSILDKLYLNRGFQVCMMLRLYLLLTLSTWMRLKNHNLRTETNFR